MAISFSNSNAVGFDNATTGNLSITASVGDFVLLLLSSDGSTATGTPSFETPNIWTQLVAPIADAGGTNIGAVYYRVWQSGDDAIQTITLAGAERALAISAVYSGVDASDPFDSFAVDANNAAGTSLIMPTNFTPTVDNCMVVGFLALESGNAGNPVITTWPTGTGTFNERRDNVGGPPGTGAGSSSAAFADWLQTTAGSMGATPTCTTSGGSTTYVGIWIALQEDPNALTVDTISDNTLEIGQTGIVLGGSNFGATQGTGKVEIGDSVSYGSATLVEQTVTSWGDTSITFNFIRSSGSTYLPQGELYVFVTNDGATQQGSIPASFGRESYLASIEGDIGGREPDFLHEMNGTLADTYTGFNLSQTAGVTTYTGSGLCRDTNTSWQANATNAKVEIANGIYHNITVVHGERLVFGWVRFPNQYNTPTLFFEEGGGVNNLYLALGFGGRLLANYADSNQDGGIGTQAISDFNLSPNRTYHIALQFDLTLGTGNNFVKCFIDGIEQDIDSLEVSNGTIQNVTTQSVHSGDYGYGASNGNLDTGGTDINYPAALNSLFNFWGSYCEGANGRTTGDPPTGAQINTTLFQKGVRSVETVFSDTESNMQTAFETDVDGTDFGDVPLGVLVERKTGGGSFSIEATDVVFSSRASLHILFLGTAGETLTVTNGGTGNITQAKCAAPYGGTITIVNPNKLTITGVEAGSRIAILNGTTIIGGTTAHIGGDFVFTTTLTSVDVAVISLDNVYLRRTGVALSANTLLPLTEFDDVVFSNP